MDLKSVLMGLAFAAIWDLGLHRDADVASFRLRLGDLEIDERIRRLDRQRLLVSDGLHAWSPWWAIACHLTCRAGVLLASTVKTGN